MKNSEILFIYDAKMCNPNGDPDSENKPRMDWTTQRNLVSDVRLKRYIRDYLYERKGKDIFVRKENGKNVDATQRVESLKLEDRSEEAILNAALENWIDVRLFGATIPVKGAKKGEGKSIAITGPVQFTWGYSLNKVELLDSHSITSVLSGAETGEGNIGKDWRVKYSLIAFYGRINRHAAEHTKMSEEDLRLLEEAIWNSILTQTNTRSKIGQEPRFYLRVEFKEGEDVVIGDLRRFVKLDREEGLNDVSDYTLDVRPLVEELKRYKDKIERIILRVSRQLKVEGLSDLKALTSTQEIT
ncbi:MAG: type I-B CRISPR-associated protein Cas7/Csh2 [Thermotogae bacterium]|nr:type I-B CRISPR-associated protein Cas7/Csh2 [Thermotogota bacterium]